MEAPENLIQESLGEVRLRATVFMSWFGRSVGTGHFVSDSVFAGFSAFSGDRSAKSTIETFTYFAVTLNQRGTGRVCWDFQKAGILMTAPMILVCPYAQEKTG
jgi:hypothetical protein